MGEIPIESRTFQIEDGSLLVLYTDGLVEDRQRDIDDGLNFLRDVFDGQAATASLDDLCRAALAGVYAHQQRDDIAILIARLGRIPADHHVTWTLPAELTSAARARSLIREPLERWKLGELIPTTELLVSELVTNAIRHATGDVTLRMVLEGSLVCEVLDGSAALPRLRHAGRDEECGRGLEVVSQFAQRWGARRTPQGKIVWCEQAIPDTGTGRRTGHRAAWPTRTRPAHRAQVAAPRVSCLIDSLPFCMIPMRWARRATELSWVTRMRVSPVSRHSCSSRPMISSRVPSSRLPVGSSASSTFGSLTRARAIATRCCWPPDSSDGQVPGPLAETDVLQRRRGPRLPVAPPRTPSGTRATSTFSSALQRRDQVEGLEDEPDRAGADLGDLGFPQPRQVLAVELDDARGGPVQPAEDLQQGGLPVPGRALDGQPLAVVDDQVHAGQRIDSGRGPSGSSW